MKILLFWRFWRCTNLALSFGECSSKEKWHEAHAGFIFRCGNEQILGHCRT